MKAAKWVKLLFVLFLLMTFAGKTAVLLGNTLQKPLSPSSIQTTANAAVGPALFFSDLISGPGNGLGDGLGEGTIITVWGSRLGSSQGTSKVYFRDSGGQIFEAAHIYYWKNADGTLPGGPADLYTHHKMQEVAFSIPSAAAEGAGRIYIEVNGAQSNELDFSVQAGNIYFVKTSGNDDSGDGSWGNPWQTIVKAKDNLSPGDIAYIGNGVSQTEDDAYGARVNLNSHGEEGNPKALVSYPGAAVGVGTAAHERAFHNWVSGGPDYRASYWTISKFSITSAQQGIPLSSGLRIVATYFTGPGDGQTGIVAGGGNHLKVIGNEFDDVGDPNGTKLYHVLYISGVRRSSPPRAETEYDREVGWNYFHDCRANRAINIYSEQSYAAFIEEHRVHDNFIINQRGDGILIGNYITGENWIYNNVVINAGLGPDWDDGISGHAGISVEPGHEERASTIHLYNNTIYGCGDTGVWATAPGQLNFDEDALNRITLNFKNNIIFSTGHPYLSGWSSIPSAGNHGNLWYGDGTAPAWDESAISADPDFVNVATDNYSLSSSSPAIDAGVDIAAMTTMDFWGNPRLIDGDNNGSAETDMGAFEYQPALTLHAFPANQTIDLTWSVDATLPVTATWRISYDGLLGDQSSPIVDIPNLTRTYTLTGLTNYTPYTITLKAMVDNMPIMTDTVTAVPTDIFVYLPLVLK